MFEDDLEPLKLTELTTARPFVGERVPLRDGYVSVRGLSRAQALFMNKLQDKGVAAMEQYMLSCAMVEPAMTQQDVAQWQAGSEVGEIDAVVDVIKRLSGMEDDAGKSGLPPVRG